MKRPAVKDIVKALSKVLDEIMAYSHCKNIHEGKRLWISNRVNKLKKPRKKCFTGYFWHFSWPSKKMMNLCNVPSLSQLRGYSETIGQSVRSNASADGWWSMDWK